MSMYDFLLDTVPDYNGYLPVQPQIVLGIDGDKQIRINKGRGISEERIVLSDQSLYRLKLTYNGLKQPDFNLLFNFYHDPDKACGIANSFYFSAPTQLDSYTYVVRFDSGWQSILSSYEVFKIAQIFLFVLGRKPV